MFQKLEQALCSAFWNTNCIAGSTRPIQPPETVPASHLGWWTPIGTRQAENLEASEALIIVTDNLSTTG
jgi:hypothetical protein